MNKIRTLLPLVAALGITCAFFGCSLSPKATTTATEFSDGGDAGKNGTPANPSGTTQTITAANQSLAASKVTQSNAALESIMSGGNIMNADFAQTNLAYKEAIAANPNNTQAQFGAAITELLMVNQNSELQSFMDSTGMAKTGGLFKSRLIPLQVNASNAEAPAKLLMKLANTTPTDIPKISEIQAIVKDSLLPRIIYALDRMSIVENDPTFSFKITPKMLGSSSGDTLELDAGEVFVADAGLRIIRSVLQILIAYNVDIDNQGSYTWLENANDSVAAVNLKRLLETPSFLALNSYGAGSMRGAIVHMRTSVEKLKDGISSIKSETDDQANDIIKTEFIDSANSQLGRNNGTVTSLTQALDTVSYILNNPYTVKIQKASIRINISSIFDNPINDLKTKLPYYRWKNASQWRTVDTSRSWYNYVGNTGGDYVDSYNSNTYSYTFVQVPAGTGSYVKQYDSDFMPIEFTYANGTVISDSLLSANGPEFPDYTFAGLFPDMTTKQKWLDFARDSQRVSEPISPYSLNKIGFSLGEFLK